jgi:hypothetical protein
VQNRIILARYYLTYLKTTIYEIFYFLPLRWRFICIMFFGIKIVKNDNFGFYHVRIDKIMQASGEISKLNRLSGGARMKRDGFSKTTNFRG